MSPVRLEPAAPRSRVKLSTTKPLRSLAQMHHFSLNLNSFQQKFSLKSNYLRTYSVVVKRGFNIFICQVKKRLTSVIDTSILCTLCYSYMRTLANSEDPDGMLHNAVLHKGLHCFLDKNDLQGNNCITCGPLVYTMDHPMFIVSIQKEESISA